MRLWPAFLDRIYWRWYTRRHPYQGMVIPLAVLYRQMNHAIKVAFTLSTPEMEWMKTFPTEAIQLSGRENRILFLDYRPGRT